MQFAIYSRKSKWTGRGDSIENQLVMCREYIMANYPDVKEEEIYEYEDEGFSGKNTQRPQFQKMMVDMKKEHFDYLVCYKLDRLGRNLSDLVNLIEELNKLETSFISIREKFDTSTPIGRAMMYFTGVLAQMEREQIAERVRDNMLMLARTGRWLGGTTPLGFDSKKAEILSDNQKARTSYYLVANKEEMEMVQFIYGKFLDIQSLTWLETYFLQNHIRTKNGKLYQISTIRDILTNPVYCRADKDSYLYFTNLGCQVCIESHELDGIRGFIGYGKTSSLKYRNKQNEPSEWIISVGRHEGILSGRDWVKVQQILENNKKKGDNFRKVHNPVSLLSGILYCRCGAVMRPKNYAAHQVDANGNRTFAYLCTKKEKSNRKDCNICNVHGNILDQKVCDKILNTVTLHQDMHQSLQKLLDALKQEQIKIISEHDILSHEIEEKRNCMNQLVFSLGKSNGNTNFLNYVEKQIEQLDRECKLLEKKMEELSKDSIIDNVDKNKQLNDTKKQLLSFSDSFEMLSIQERRDYLRGIIKRVIWDGEKVDVYF